MTKLNHTANDSDDKYDEDDKPVSGPIVLLKTHAKLVTGLQRALLNESVLY